MKTAVVFFLCCIVLFSCADQTLDKSDTRLPVLERHYNMETGEAIAEKSFVYDNNENLIREKYKPLISKIGGGYEITNEYDVQQHRILTFVRHIGQVESYELIRFSYDGDRKVEEQYYGADGNSQLPHTKVMYYYTGNQADSSVTLINHYSLSNRNDYKFNVASYFTYDNQGRMLEEQRRSSFGNIWVATMNSYDVDLLKETCNPVTGQEGAFNCTRYEYNSQKQLIRKYATLTGTADRLLEEHTYTNGLLTETKIFDQKYYLPLYNPDPTPYTLQIKYEY